MNGRPDDAGRAEGRTVPFDYSFVFQLGQDPRRRQHRKTVTVSIESAFVAVSIGYGFIPPPPIRFGIPDPAAGAAAAALVVGGGNGVGGLAVAEPGVRALRAVQLGQVPILDVIRGFERAQPALRAAADVNPLFRGLRINPRLVARFQVADPNVPVELDDESATELFELTSTPIEDLQFKYALFDDGSGREYQSEPILSTAGLGMPTGERPFRYFARPIRFEPQTTIRMEVTEVSAFTGSVHELHVVLQGYKVVGGGAPTARRAARERRFTRRRR